MNNETKRDVKFRRCEGNVSGIFSPYLVFLFEVSAMFSLSRMQILFIQLIMLARFVLL